MNTKSKIIIVIVVLFIGAVIVILVQVAPIIAGFGAKDLCSCVFVGGRTEASVLENELGSGPLSFGTFKINRNDSSATGSLFGFSKVKAIYRKGLGCTLVREKTENELQKELSELTFNKPVLSDTIPWPLGTKTNITNIDGVNMKDLTSAIDEAFHEENPEMKKNTRSVVVVYNGNIILEKYAPGFEWDTPQIGWSMSKSITNTMIGILAGEGKLDIYGPAPVASWKDTKDPRHQITTDHLLRMSSGLEWEENYSKSCSATIMLYQKANMGLYAAEQNLQYKPEEEWYYSSGTTNILHLIMRDILGDKAYYDLLYDKLFFKLGIRSAIFEPDASGTLVGSSYIWASARDWARLGLLYLNDGVWNGDRILPEEWVAYSTTPTPKAPQGKYGAQFWLNAGALGNPSGRVLPDVPADTYFMDGYEGQRVFIIPSKNIVVVRLGQNKKGAFDFNDFLSSVLNTID